MDRLLDSSRFDQFRYLRSKKPESNRIVGYAKFHTTLPWFESSNPFVRNRVRNLKLQHTLLLFSVTKTTELKPVAGVR